MSDYPVKPRSDEEVRKLAKKLREFFGVAADRRVDVIACAKSRSIWTVHGERELRLELRSDDEMGSDDGTTIYEDKLIIMAVKRSVHYAAYMGNGHARNTFGHEFGHCAMHDGAPKSRRTLGNVKFKFIQPFESAEHQAKVFAPAFLINDEVAARLGSAEEISIECGISLESATIYFRQLLEQRDRHCAKHTPNGRRGTRRAFTLETCASGDFLSGTLLYMPKGDCIPDRPQIRVPDLRHRIRPLSGR